MILSVFVLFSGNVIMYVPLHVIIITIIICDKILLQLNFLSMIKNIVINSSHNYNNKITN